MGNPKIELRGTLICQDEAEAAIVRAELPEHIRLTHLEVACELFEVVESEDPLRWIVHELNPLRRDTPPGPCLRDPPPARVGRMLL